MFRRLAISVMALGLGVVATIAQSLQQPGVSKAEDWTALFNRRQGWTGADGIFAIPLNGYEGPDHAAGNKNLFVFSDTFIGQVDSQTNARKNSVMIHNSLAVLSGGIPVADSMHFLWGKDSKGAAISAFTPSVPSVAGLAHSWYWLQDGFYHHGFVYDLALILTDNAAGAAGFNFKEVGVALIKIPIGVDGEPDISKAVQMDTPLYFSGGGRTFYFGCGIMPNTPEAGAPNPDGYVYVYGRNALVVARVLPDDFEDFTKWAYWDGSGWNPDISKTASLGLGGPELSVTPVSGGSLQGKYLLVSSQLSPDIFVRVGDSPHGPFGAAINVYKAPEWDTTVPVYTYNAKAHPSLSAHGDWLVTYNVNTSNASANLAHADIYHPRFFKMRFDPAQAIRFFPEAKAKWENNTAFFGMEMERGMGWNWLYPQGGSTAWGLDGRTLRVTVTPK